MYMPFHEYGSRHAMQRRGWAATLSSKAADLQAAALRGPQSQPVSSCAACPSRCPPGSTRRSSHCTE
jgi:hypothetical protein